MNAGTLGILAGDFGFNVTYLALVMGIAAAITTVAVIVVVWSTKHPDEVDKHSLGKFEPHWTVIIIAILALFSLTTITYLPYPYAHPNVTPTMTVDVQASQFAWCLSTPPNWGTNCQVGYKIPMGSIVLFDVRSTDVTHGFGVYSSGGTLLFQTQVMPNYTNSIMYQFKTPGTYYIRCLEFCGYGHYGMINQMNVTSS